MAFYPGLVPLRDLLADLYPAKGIARAVVNEAGLRDELIDFDGPAIEFWTNILAFAQGNNRVADLVAVAHKHYDGNEMLLAAERDYLTAEEDRIARGVPKSASLVMFDFPPPRSISPPLVSPFVGREQELDYYADRLREQGIVAITGMVGVGKSSLAAALAARFAPETHIFWHAFYQGEDVRSMIWRLAAFLAHHGQAELWALLNRERAEPPAASQLDFALQLLRGKEFVLVLDNVHLLFDREQDDPLLGQTIERLEWLARSADARIILASRRSPHFMKLVRSAPLEGLSRPDTTTLLKAHGVTLDDETLDTLHARTEGNVELLMLAVEALRHAEDAAGMVARLARADDIERYLTLEVDESLDEDDRQVMVGLAVLLGQPATRDAIEETLARGRLRQILTNLTNRYLLRTQQGDEDKEYLQHAVLRDFYYQLLSKRERIELHRRAARYYRDVDIKPLRAAQQSLRAGEAQQAAALVTEDVYALLARGQAAGLSACLDELAAAELPPLPAAQVKAAVAEVQQFYRNTEKAIAAGEDALALLAGLGADPEARRLAARVCWILNRIVAPADPEQALAYAQQGLDAVPEGDTELRAMLLIRQGAVYAMGGEANGAEAVLGQALDLLGVEQVASRIDVLLNLGVVRSMQGDLADGVDYFNQALTFSDQLDDPFRELKAHNNLSINQERLGDWDGALANLRRAYDLAERLGDVRHHAVVAINLGDLLRKRHAHDEAGEVLATALRQAEAAQFPLAIVNARFNLAHLALAESRLDDAAGHLDAAAAMIDEHDLADRRPELLYTQAELWLAQENLVAAHEAAAASLAAARAQSMVLEEGIALRTEARIFCTESQHAKAVALLEQSMTCLEPVSRYEYAQSQLELGFTLNRLGKHIAEKRTVNASRAIFTSLGIR